MNRLLILATLCCTLMIPAHAEKFLNRVVAIVNGDIITLSELEQAMAMMAPQLGMMKGVAATNAYSAVRKAALDRLIDDRLIKIAMQQANQTADESQIDNALTGFLHEKKISMAQLEAALTQHGLTIADFRERLGSQIAQQQFVQDAVGRKIVPSDNEVRDYYNRHHRQIQASRDKTAKGRNISFEALKPQLQQMLFSEKMDQALEQYVAELRARAYIEIKE